MRIAHNIQSLNANRLLDRNLNSQSKWLEKLTSGLSINRAGDNAAGLSISEKMRTQIRGLEMASRNSQDAVSLVQTADGALGEIQNIAQRMRELSVQAVNDTNTEDDRESIQLEISQLIKEVDSIAEKTSFNDLKLLNGSLAGSGTPLKSFLDKNTSGIIYVEEKSDFSTTQVQTGNKTTAGYDALKNVLQQEIVPQAVKSITDAYASTFGYLNSSSIGIGLKLYNDSSSSTLASVGVGWSYYGDGTVVNDMLTYNLSVNMSSLKYDGSGNLTEDSRTSLETTIVHEMMHALMDEALTNGMLGITDGKLDSSNQFPKWFKEGMAQTAAGGYANCNDWVNGSLKITETTLESQISSIVKNSSNSLKSGSTSSQYGTGYLACMYLGYMASGSGSVDSRSLADGVSKVLTEIKNGKSLNTVIDEVSGGKYKNKAQFESEFGDVESAKFIADLTRAVGSTGNGGLASGDIKDSDLLSNSPYSTPLFKLDTTNETIKNIYPSDVNVFDGGGSSTASSGTISGVPGGGKPGVTYGGIQIQVGANKGQNIRISIDSAKADSLGLDSVSVLSSNNASESIELCNKAVTKISNIRSSLGAYQNRLEYAMSNINNTKENMESSESRIRDADMAKSMSQYSKFNILAQAAQSMLTQSNQNPQRILSLLQ